MRLKSSEEGKAGFKKKKKKKVSTFKIRDQVCKQKTSQMLSLCVKEARIRHGKGGERLLVRFLVTFHRWHEVHSGF